MPLWAEATQDHRAAQVGRGLWSNPQLRAGSPMGPDLLPEGSIQLHLEHPQGRRRHHLSRQSQLLHQPH